MTSEIEVIKTNEFVRRRKLRLQQVREQSKDIAKKIRQRAKVEKLRHIVDLDAEKEKEYLQKQEKIVKRLEHLYAKGLHNVGSSHNFAFEMRQQDKPEKTDLSKLRGKEAVAEVRRKKQEKLDEQKKLLDRKLRARENANELSREKSSVVANKLLTKPLTSEIIETIGKDVNPSDVTIEDKEDKQEDKNHSSTAVTKNDIATQWDSDVLPNEWELKVPALSLPKDDSVKEVSSHNLESKSEKSKKIDLFALSDEMPSSLRGGLTNVPEEVAHVRPSLTIVSEYLQNRGLHLRETDKKAINKKQSDDLQSIKQTLMRTRASKTEARGSHLEKSSKSSNQESALFKKNSVTMYNHSTRDTRGIPFNDEKLVVRDPQPEEDAYLQAMKECSVDKTNDKENQKKIQETRNKIAMTKQNVEKEYKDTMMFLNSLSKDKSNKSLKYAFMDERCKEMQKESHQHKLQNEFRKIQKECRKHNHTNGLSKGTLSRKSREQSKSPTKGAKEGLNNDFNSSDFQYSWMPVPESDGSLAIHTIPTTLRESKTGNTVKFSNVDSYHEYRSRHKHTPPTKDTDGHSSERNIIETVIIQQNTNESIDSSVSSDTSSVENLQIRSKFKKRKDKKTDQELTNAERIIIYKVLEQSSKFKKKESDKSKLTEHVSKSLNLIDTGNAHTVDEDSKDEKQMGDCGRSDKHIKKTASLEQINEGVYKTVNANGDNITSLYFSDNPEDVTTEDERRRDLACQCSKKLNKDAIHKDPQFMEQNGNIPSLTRFKKECKCGNAKKYKEAKNQSPTVKEPSAVTSTSSFKTATNDKANEVLPNGGYLKLIDEGGQEAGKFYIGATGFLKDDAYEVIIQLRKKETTKDFNNRVEKEVQKNSLLMKEGKRFDTEPESTVDKATDHEIHEQLLSRSSPKIESKRISPTNLKTSNDIDVATQNFKNDIEVPCIPDSSTNIKEKSSNVTDNKSDKGVCTPFPMSYAIPSYVTKADSVSKPVMSTYTQTTLNSPNQRPVFIHMSSSTSTAYMSPPEMVLPKFLRQGYPSYDEKYYSNENLVDAAIGTTEHRHCKNFINCSCRTCTHSKKLTSNDYTISSLKNDKIRRIRTSSSTVREHIRDIFSNKDSAHSSPISRKSKCRCHKCENHSRTKICLKSHTHKNKNGASSNVKCSSRNLIMRLSTSTASTHKNIEKNFKKSHLDPIVKDYVNKLLALNKQGLKAIDVANQDCSSVTTPGSSIINVPNNTEVFKPMTQNKISLEQIKDALRQQIIEEYEKSLQRKTKHFDTKHTKTSVEKWSKVIPTRKTAKKPVHKVKSLNIPKYLFRNNNIGSQKHLSTSSLSVKGRNKEKVIANKIKLSSNSSSSPRQFDNYERKNKNVILIKAKHCLGSDNNNSENFKLLKKKSVSSKVKCQHIQENQSRPESFKTLSHRATSTSESTSPELNVDKFSPIQKKKFQEPTHTSTQTSQNIDNEESFMKLAEDKLLNMEKIADLTEKCTKRLSNLAKVLEEVRKNKSLAYNQISTSDSTSDTDQKSDKNTSINKTCAQFYDPGTELRTTTEIESPIPIASAEVEQKDKDTVNKDYTPLLADIPRYGIYKPPTGSSSDSELTNEVNQHSSKNMNVEQPNVKSRGKPPPALSRINLKRGEDIVVPHELSTVIEVDSPMSVKLKNQSSHSDVKSVATPENDVVVADYNKENSIVDGSSKLVNPDLLQGNMNLSKYQTKILPTDSSLDDTKMQMIDLKQFNEIMLRPFISIQEYAKQYNIGAVDQVSNLEDIPKDDINDDLSSLRSDGSLPDVIAELLKRNIINEPFKFDTASNVNSTTASSESTTSMLALSKARRKPRKSSVLFKNKENIAETSDTMSISSNPDLEYAFKRLGMGWASSTLKKTKERLALSSSSNTSSSSMSFKIKSIDKQSVANVLIDSASSVLETSQKQSERKNVTDSGKNAEQQTTNSMTVKEFLTNELAKKITFTNKSNRNCTDDEFVSLYETKMPEEMKQSSQIVRDDSSVGNSSNGNNNRARTSTPVQIFKSTTYHSSSSSNVSNCLFSNVDELSSVKVTSNSIQNHSSSDKDDLTVPNYSLKTKKNPSDCSKSD